MSRPDLRRSKDETPLLLPVVSEAALLELIGREHNGTILLCKTWYGILQNYAK